MPKEHTTIEEILREHLPYELDMLRSTFERLRDGVADDVFRNALIESFSIHARSLIEFFRKGKGKYVKTALLLNGEPDLFRNGKVSQASIEKLSTQTAHLTLKRTADPRGKLSLIHI